MRRIIIDTNILVSAFIAPHSRIASLVQYLFDESIVLSSIATLNELRVTLNRPKFDRYISRQERTQFIKDYAGTTEPVLITQQIQLCRDP